MPLFTTAERRFAELVVQLVYCNPFQPERIALERTALGAEFDETQPDWNIRQDQDQSHPNLLRVVGRTNETLNAARARLAEGVSPTTAETELYEGLLLFAYYHELLPDLDRLIEGQENKGGPAAAQLYRRMCAWAKPYAEVSPQARQLVSEWPHMFAGCFQLRRAFSNIYQFIVGTSRVTTELRAAVWESIFTHDMRRYRRWLYRQMVDYATLITGPSGTGKELVARAIGLSRYIPYDATKGEFSDDFRGSFFAIHLAALSPTLIESELFGHQRGAFTGAVATRTGWLEACPATGSVFLDEIGELDASIQVKLLRVLQNREFSRLGESKLRRFNGKIIAATNRNLGTELQSGRFREDLYYRLCSDTVEVPSLQARIQADPRELRELIRHIVRHLAGGEADSLADELELAVVTQLGANYAWPGNVRELEQCLRNLLIRRKYQPPTVSSDAAADPAAMLAQAMRSGSLTAEDLLRRYCRLVYDQTGSYEATARQLQIDRRTVKSKVQAASE